MKTLESLKSLVTELYPLHRTLVCDGMDQALEIIGSYMPEEANYNTETYPPLTRAWTWRVPERFVVHEAYLETEDGNRLLDFRQNPLHLVSYSLPVDKILSWEELQPHLHYSTTRPHAIPWMYEYYERDWGFCLTKVHFDKLPREKRYHAMIRSEFRTDPDQGLRVGVADIHAKGGRKQQAGEILVCSHVCHPYQANDGISGAVTAIEVARRLVENPLPAGSMNVRFLFCPETIGSICYLSHHEDMFPRLKGGIFCEMTGNLNSLVLQRSRQDDHLMDRIARYVLSRTTTQFREGAFREVIGNDEIVINGPGVNVPCISISRWPYEEYHTDEDTPDIIHEDRLVESADVVEEIIRIYASNYVPSRAFRGPVFLSGYGLWVDWRADARLNDALEQMMLRLEGKHSVFDIAAELNLDYWSTRGHIEKFVSHGLVQRLPIPSTSYRDVPAGGDEEISVEDSDKSA